MSQPESPSVQLLPPTITTTATTAPPAKKLKKKRATDVTTKTTTAPPVSMEDEQMNKLPSHSMNHRTDVLLPLHQDNSLPPHPNAVVAVCFPTGRPLRVLLDGIPMLTDCTFKIENANRTKEFPQDPSYPTLPSFSGLSLEAMDNSHTCVIFGKVQAEVTVYGGDGTNKQEDDSKQVAEYMSFCVSVNLFATHIKSVDPSHTLWIYRIKGSSDLFIKSMSSTNGCNWRVMSISTLCQDAQTFNINDIRYNYTLEFDLGELRNIVKFAKSINCADVRIRILEHKTLTRSNQSGHEQRHSFCIVHVYGEASYDECCFCSSTDVTNETTTMIIKNSDISVNPMNVRLADLEEKFNEIYPINYLLSFLKAVDRHTITMRLAPDAPMNMTTSMGDAQSFLTYMLAGKQDKDIHPNIIQSFCA